MNIKLKKVLQTILSPITGKTKFQSLFEILYEFSLYGMNIGVGSNPKISGEKKVISYISKKYKQSNSVTIFDVGANVGNYTILLREIFLDKADIYSFEPSKITFDTLRNNIGVMKNIKLYKLGFGSDNTEVHLHSDSSQSGLSSIYKRRLDHFNINMHKTEQIEIKTIDTFCLEHKISHIHFLKLDVEGHEFKVLEGAINMLRGNAIDYIQFEFGGCNIDSRTYFQDFYYLLKDKYRIYRIVKNGLNEIHKYKEIYESFITTNYLAERK
jgi:FkbM family methyltransferase